MSKMVVIDRAPSVPPEAHSAEAAPGCRCGGRRLTGRPALGTPGAGGGASGFGGDVSTSSGAGKAGPPNGPTAAPAQGSGFPGRGVAPAAGVYEHGDPGGTAGPG